MSATENRARPSQPRKPDSLRSLRAGARQGSVPHCLARWVCCSTQPATTSSTDDLPHVRTYSAGGGLSQTYTDTYTLSIDWGHHPGYG
jgi:hypothetical protein